MSNRLPFPEVKYAITQLGPATKGFQQYPGGLDLVTPTLELHPGALRNCLNFECSTQGGYGRIDGYERVDGRQAPSTAGFIIIQFDSFVNVPAVGELVNQVTSGSTGIVSSVNLVPPYVAVTKTTGAFDTTGLVNKVGPIPVGTAVTQTVFLDARLTAIYTDAAASIYRALIQKVPGSGPVRGVVYLRPIGLSDSLYAFRDNVGGTLTECYRASPAGWVKVPFHNVVEFTAGGPNIQEPLDGDSITQGANSAIIRRVMWRSGSWEGSTAVGGFVIDAPAPHNFVAGAALISDGSAVILSGPSTPITMLPGGRFEFDEGNFTGRVSTNRAYGCDSVNKGFEFDGTVLAPITTGLSAPSTDSPSHVAVHKGYLFFSYGSSAMYSSPGAPFKWSAVDGAGEIAVGDTVTAMKTLPGNQATATLAIFQTNNTSFNYGNSASSWQLVSYTTSVGARPYSVQNLFDCFSFDDFGVMTLQTTLNFGNFSPSSITRNILPFIIAERATIVASSMSRTKAQYRIFFRDGYGIFLTVSNQNVIGSTPVLFPDPVTCAYNAKATSGDEVNYFGSTNGFVYQMDRGTSFDGKDLDAFITPALDPIRSPRIRKRFRAASIEISGLGYAEVNFGYKLSYSSPATLQSPTSPVVTPFNQAPTWDTFTWDDFTWDGVTLSPTDVDMVGTGENVQVTIQSGTTYISSYQVNSIIYHYTMRRGVRV